ncbi:hypothetical protein llap_4640 [Limosa lapponica baueri]|uniref:Uncharacterized protein n=1 Tax=Limosa lapponica baueri TaxID=1758121 RepID=A0A2I0UG84_LIMLA|nr:hypothetical protein llap_4640 [Limosa lapponica baueri]
MYGLSSSALEDQAIASLEGFMAARGQMSMAKDGVATKTYDLRLKFSVDETICAISFLSWYCRSISLYLYLQPGPGSAVVMSGYTFMDVGCSKFTPFASQAGRRLGK